MRENRRAGRDLPLERKGGWLVVVLISMGTVRKFYGPPYVARSQIPEAPRQTNGHINSASADISGKIKI